jgi:hypothetical protein
MDDATAEPALRGAKRLGRPPWPVRRVLARNPDFTAELLAATARAVLAERRRHPPPAAGDATPGDVRAGRGVAPRPR